MIGFIKRLVRNFFPRPWQIAIDNLGRVFANENGRAMQMMGAYLLKEKYESIKASDSAGPEINQHEFKVFSQHGEDGILLHIFSKIQPKTFRFVEFGTEQGMECNTANLSINFGWSGLLMDGSSENVNIARRYYQRKLRQKSGNVRIEQCFVTAENINESLSKNSATGEIDLLCIDIDGNDYWVWKAISAVSPRVVVIEYNASLGAEKSLTIPYAPCFERYKAHASGFYHGASLSALAKLAESKGYVLVGCDSAGIDAFFVRKDVAAGKMVPVSVEDAFFPHAKRTQKLTVVEQFSRISKMDFVEV